MRSGYDLKGYRNPGLAARQLRTYLEICAVHGVRPGKFRFRGKIPKTAPIVLCGASAPVFAAKALDFVNQSLGLCLTLEEIPSQQEFIPDPFRPVPLARISLKTEPVRDQSDWFEGQKFNLNHPRFSVQIEDDLPKLARQIRLSKSGSLT